MMCLDRAGRMLGRVLSVTGVPLSPNSATVQALVNVYEAVVEREPEAAGHLALTLSRPGVADISDADDEWTEVLRLALDDRTDGAWTLHLAAGGQITLLVETWAWKWSPRGLDAAVFRAAVALNQ